MDVVGFGSGFAPVTHVIRELREELMERLDWSSSLAAVIADVFDYPSCLVVGRHAASCAKALRRLGLCVEFLEMAGIPPAIAPVSLMLWVDGGDGPSSLQREWVALSSIGCERYCLVYRGAAPVDFYDQSEFKLSSRFAAERARFDLALGDGMHVLVIERLAVSPVPHLVRIPLLQPPSPSVPPHVSACSRLIRPGDRVLLAHSQHRLISDSLAASGPRHTVLTVEAGPDEMAHKRVDAAIMGMDELERWLSSSPGAPQFRLLPGGRLIAVLSVDDLGLPSLVQQLASVSKRFETTHLMLEQILVEHEGLPGKTSRVSECRLIADVPLLPGSPTGLTCAWIKSPLDGFDVSYIESVFTKDEVTSGGNALQFARDYRNPWLIRSLVSIGLRTENPLLRQAWANSIRHDSRSGPADVGAALCVLAYHALAEPSGDDPRLLDDIAAYLAQPSGDNPTVFRWRVSLTYVLGLLHIHNDDAAFRYFLRVSHFAATDFHFTLLTKTICASYWVAFLKVTNGQSADAVEFLKHAYERYSRELIRALADLELFQQASFAVRELCSVISMLSKLHENISQLTLYPDRADILQHPTLWAADSTAACPAQTHLYLKSQIAVLTAAATKQRSLMEKREQYMVELEAGRAWLESQWRDLKTTNAAQAHKIAELQSQLAEIRRICGALPVSGDSN